MATSKAPQCMIRWPIPGSCPNPPVCAIAERCLADREADDDE